MHEATSIKPVAVRKVARRPVRSMQPVHVFMSAGILVAAAVGLAAFASGAKAYPSNLIAAADTLASTTAAGGQGYRFDVVQRQVEYAKPGGSLIPVAGLAAPNGVDHVYVNSVLARGSVAPGAFWMEMRFGPDETTEAIYEQAPTMFRVIARDGALWRNDGAGWFTAAVSPGIGMDPATAALLPQLLRSVTNVADQGRDVVGGQQLHRYAGVVDVANFPGVVASDGAPFTENPVAVTLWLDSANRLVQLEGRARNLNETTFDLKVITTIRITYAAAGPPPLPAPTLAPATSTGTTLGAP
ncbi:MAG TPA: hypothetical protein VJ850_08375 [Candidatus Limnocylindrales bacterium]|nr:hypothetical protein [Candidatus Limnocylindrales bacterium]